MPTYEMPVLFRVMSKQETFDALKRAANAIFNHGGIIRKLDNLGVKSVPFRTGTHKEASHFIFYFDVPPSSLIKLKDEYNRDIDIIRTRIYKQEIPEKVECTLHEDLLPPAYRPAVQKLIQIAKEEESNVKKFKHNSGLGYYPFHK